MAKRTDPHAKGRIVPGNYEYVTSYFMGGMYERPLGMDYVAELAHTKKFFVGPTGGGPGKCAACGAIFSTGDVWRHVPTGEHIHLGKDCAGKYHLLVDRSAFELELGRHRAAEAVALQRKLNEAKRERFLAAHPDLAEDFAINHHIIQNIHARFVTYCEVSDKQIALVHKLAEEVRNPPPKEPEAPKAEVPAGRLEVRGVVLGTKLTENDFGTVFKMLVQVKNQDGSEYKVWGTVPSSLLGGDAPLKGREVSFKATLQPKEPGFGFFSRPTGAEFQRLIRNEE